MKVLAANKFYWVKGGAERYYFELADVLTRHGHEVVPFSMRDPRNLPSPYAGHFVSRVEFRDRMSPGARAAAAARVIHSAEARRRIRALVDATRPDVAHLHNIAHQLSPSILAPLREASVPIVHTLHDYKMLCPTYRFFRDGHPCELCLHGAYRHAALHRCNGGSFLASLTNALEMYVHRILGTYRDHVDRFIAPSRFLRSKMLEGGLPPDRVVHLFYCLDLARYRPSPRPGDYAIFAGRLSEEKGTDVLIEAAMRLGRFPLWIAGDGPRRAMLEKRAAGAGDRVRFLGHQQEDVLRKLVAGSRFVVVPSVWYENSPLSIYESFALGKPVVGARIGGIPELVQPGVTGELAAPGDVEELAHAMQSLWEHPDLESLGHAARERAESWFAPEKHLESLLEIYRGAGACASR